jgi:hypothetical protein
MILGTLVSVALIKPWAYPIKIQIGL